MNSVDLDEILLTACTSMSALFVEAPQGFLGTWLRDLFQENKGQILRVSLRNSEQKKRFYFYGTWKPF